MPLFETRGAKPERRLVAEIFSEAVSFPECAVCGPLGGVCEGKGTGSKTTQGAGLARPWGRLDAGRAIAV